MKAIALLALLIGVATFATLSQAASSHNLNDLFYVSESLLPRYYVFWYVTAVDGQYFRIDLSSSAPVALMVMTLSQFEAFKSSSPSRAVFSTVTSSFRSNVHLPGGGEYVVVVFNNVSGSTVFLRVSGQLVPINFLFFHDSLPAPIGLGYFGVENVSGRLIGHVIKYREAIGYVTVYSIRAYNSSPPPGVNPWGASLQLNAVLQVNTTSGTYVYWLQNVIHFNTNNDTYVVDNNVWNYTSRHSFLSSSGITGFGAVRSSIAGYYYAKGNPEYHYSLPFSLILYTRLTSVAPDYVVVSFGYNNGTGITWYDNVTIHHAGITSAALLVNPFNFTPNGNAYDLDFVFAGASNLEYTYFESLNASLGLQIVLMDGSVVTPRNLYTFGLTGEMADNLKVVMVGDYAYVVPGMDVFWQQVSPAVPKLYLTAPSQGEGGIGLTLDEAISALPAVIGVVVLLLVVWGIYKALRKLVSAVSRRW